MAEMMAVKTVAVRAVKKAEKTVEMRVAYSVIVKVVL